MWQEHRHAQASVGSDASDASDSASTRGQSEREPLASRADFGRLGGAIAYHDVVAEIVKNARDQIGSTAWSDGLQCSKFVFDILLWSLAGIYTRIHKGNHVPLLAEDWANKKLKIANFDVVSSPQPGDIISEANWSFNASGHCGIVTGNRLTTSASSIEHRIVENDWGFRNDDGRAVYRRFNPTVFDLIEPK